MYRIIVQADLSVGGRNSAGFRPGPQVRGIRMKEMEDGCVELKGGLYLPLPLLTKEGELKLDT